MNSSTQLFAYSTTRYWVFALSLLFSYSAYAQAATSVPNSQVNLSNQIGAMAILIDNEREGWSTALPYSSDPVGDNGGPGQIDWNTITISHDCDDLNVRYEVYEGPLFNPDGFRYNLLVDVDRNPMTGYRGLGNQLSIGADVLIQGGQDKITTFKFSGGTDQQAWGWQQINVYAINDQAKLGGGRDIEYKINLTDLDVFGNGVSSFNWLAWADSATSRGDFYPDNGNLGDVGTFNTYSLNYTPRADGFANPERGFFQSTQTKASHYIPLNLAKLQCYQKNEGTSLIHRFFYLESFIDSDISQQYLDLMQTDFEKIRQAGVKVIPRFAYSESTTETASGPHYGDASKERMLAHLIQLSNVLRKNSDVIATLQVGFIGLWGEWWYSDYFLADTDWNNRADIVNKMLDVLPTNRTIQIRTPRYKQNIFSTTVPVDQATANLGSTLSRIGHHNDCFVSSASDGGTYVNTLTEYPYLEEESKWLPMGGETCDYNFLSDPDPIRLSCPITLNELARLHWSFLNLDWYKPTLKKWLAEGCFSTIERKLGYELSFVQAIFDDKVKPGDAFKYSIQIKNSGFSAPFNPRGVELILRHSTGTTHSFNLPSDPRLWQPNMDVEPIIGQITIPKDFPLGTYEVLLNLPDPEPSLHNRPEYSIRLVNPNVWEAATGYNKLNHSINVQPFTYFPTAVNYMSGHYNWGTLDSLLVADQDTYDSNSRHTAGGNSTDWYATTTMTNSRGKTSKISVTYKGQYSIRNVSQNVYLYNYQTTNWDLLDNRLVGNTDDVTVSATITVNPENYVSNSGEMKLRVQGIHPSRSFDCWANALSWVAY